MRFKQNAQRPFQHNDTPPGKSSLQLNGLPANDDMQQPEMNPYESPSVLTKNRPRKNASRMMAAGCCVVTATILGFLIGITAGPMAISQILLAISGDDPTYGGPTELVGLLPIAVVLGTVGAILGAMVGVRLVRQPRRPDIYRNVQIQDIPDEDS